MKKTFLLIVCGLMFAAILPLQAKKVPPEKAEIVAQRFVESKRGLSNKPVAVRLKHTATGKHERELRNDPQFPSTPAVQDTAFYYVFNIDEDAGGGFVIIAADDAVQPVLGYSDNGHYDENNLPSNFAYWMDYLQQEIKYAIEQNLPQIDNWATLSQTNFSTTAVEPLIQTKWNQNAPYKDLCPMDGVSRSVTGCVATAIAQIMKYHRYPAQGIGQSPAYTTKTKGINVPSVDFSATTYDWDNMLNTYSGTTTTVQKNAVATLMYHCGVSVEMDYANTGSGAESNLLLSALVDYFGYDPSIQYQLRDRFNNVSWEAMLREQIDAGLPVYYTGGELLTYAHAFVCDGYDDTGKFHFNWGWGGGLDGYFVTTSLNPSIYTFNSGQKIIMNIKPNERLTEWMTEWEKITGNGTAGNPYIITNPAQLAMLALSINTSAVPYADAGVCYKLGNDIDLADYADGLFNGGVGWISIGNSYIHVFKGVFDGNNKIIKNLYINNASSYAGLFGYFNGTVKNLSVTNINVSGKSSTGGMIGYAFGGSVSNCYSTGSVTSSSTAGGIAGFLVSGSNMSNCYSTCSVTSSSSGITYVGGVVGAVNQSSVSNCYSTSMVTASSSSNTYAAYAGGVVGYATVSDISNCYSTSMVTASSPFKVYAGGVVGYVRSEVTGASGGSVSNCAALNPSISYTGSNISFGRIIGDGRNLADNMAFNDMLNPDGNTTWNNKGATLIDGEDITASAIYADGSLGGRFTSENGWTVQDGKLPGLFGNAVDMPEYLRLPTSITTEILLNGSVVCPNPTDGKFTLEFEAPGEHIVTISDISGKMLCRQTVTGQSVQMDIGNYSAGMYLLIIDDGKQQNTMRIVKN